MTGGRKVAIGDMTDREIDAQVARLEADGAAYARHADELREFARARRAGKSSNIKGGQ